ncbi:class I SAM-dependent methyltransferase [Nocardioides alcanivorans]|uniref:class I SAM-dependent methyltransferase n=1 Tax=Nocardioides alcanivorans TaxID=2897352 RepID=UPI001F29E119|nr:class I SAM-dependent methyltransferase [Nocardioides alcanivorans]
MDAAGWNARYAASELVWSATPNQYVEARLASLPPGRAVDLGAGEGRNALWLAGLGWQASAVDFSDAGLAKGAAIAERLGVEIDWVCADVLSWAPVEPVDLTLVAYLQFPLAERRRLVANACAMTAPGGTLFWISHDSHNLPHGVGGPQDPSLLTTADELATLLDEGWDVIEASRVERQVTAADATRETAYDTLLIARAPAGG